MIPWILEAISHEPHGPETQDFTSPKRENIWRSYGEPKENLA
jgi:hypothetical protein